MKKIYWLLAICGLLFSCEEKAIVSEMERSKDENVLYIENLDQLNQIMDTFLNSYNPNDITLDNIKLDQLPMTRSLGDEAVLTYKGPGWLSAGGGEMHPSYSSVKFAQSICDVVGLNPTYYYTCTLWGCYLQVGFDKTVIMPVLDYIPKEANLGFLPDISTTKPLAQRGYKAEIVNDGNSLLLKTALLRCNRVEEIYTYVMWDVWAPIRREDIVWEYAFRYK